MCAGAYCIADGVALSEKLALLRGEMPTGEVALYGKAKVSFFGAEGTFSGEVRQAEAKGSIDSKLALKEGGAVSDDGDASLKTREDGSWTLGLTKQRAMHDKSVPSADKGTRLGLELTVQDGALKGFDASLGPVGAKVEDGQLSEVRGSVGTVSAKLDKDGYEMGIGALFLGSEETVKAGLGSVVRGDAKNATDQGGVAATASALDGQVEVSGEVGVKFQGLSQAAIRRSLENPVAFWETPPELEKRVPWDRLPGELRAVYEKALGWTKDEWAAELNRPPQADVPRILQR